MHDRLDLTYQEFASIHCLLNMGPAGELACIRLLRFYTGCTFVEAKDWYRNANNYKLNLLNPFTKLCVKPNCSHKAIDSSIWCAIHQPVERNKNV